MTTTRATRTTAWLALVAGLVLVGSTALAQNDGETNAGDTEAAEGAEASDGADGDEGEEESSGGGGLFGQGAMPDESAGETTAEGLGRPMPDIEGEDELLRELDAFEAALSVYEDEMQDYRDTISRVVELEYARQRARITEFYNVEIDALRIEERERRLAAIGDFEQFLERYPNDVDYTPDVMFRLAELWYEQSVDDFNEADREYERRMTRYERGIDPEPPDEPRRDFSRTLDLFAELMRRFPDYRQIDGAYYLAGVALDEMDEWEDAVHHYRYLVENYPDSDFAQESWLRVGEYYFEEVDFHTARVAYLRALRYGESRWYDKIVFKLGWCEYLLGDYDLAIAHFSELLDYYQREEDNSQQALKAEALQYFAIAMAEEDWDLDGERDVDFIVPRVENYLPVDGPEWTIEVLDALAEILKQYERHEFAVDVYRVAIDRYPLDRESPRRHEQIVAALGRLGDTDEAFDELRRLAERYARGSEWYNEQERLGNTEAMAYADALARGSLLDSANYYYLQADETAARASMTGDPVVEAQAIEQYRFAARLYESFLDEYPNVDEAYQVRMYLAQSLFFSTQFEDAAEQYGQVRDSEVNDEFLAAAARQAIVAYEQALNREIDAGRLEPRAWPAYNGPMLALAAEAGDDGFDDDPDGGGAGEEPRDAPLEEPIPDLSENWAGAIDRYVELGITADEDPDLGPRNLFAAGKLYFDYKHYEPARERFVAVLDLCRDIPETAYAAAFIIDSYAAVNDIDSLRFWDAELTRRSACVPAELMEALASDLDRIAMGEMAERAEALAAEGDYRGAAEEYVRLANAYVDNDETAPLGLYNAGLIYEQELDEYALAMEQFQRLVDDYPQHQYADDSLVRIAVNARKFFDFDRAIATYLVLEEIGFSEPDLVEFPLLEAAELMEYSQQYADAAVAYEEWLNANPSDYRAAAIAYKLGTLWESAGNEREMLDAFERFRSDYGRAAANEALTDPDAAYIDTLYRTAEYYRANGNEREAQRYYERVLDEFDIRQPDAVPAKYAAGQARYEQVFADYEEWASITFGETQASQERAITERLEGMEPLVLDFESVVDYGSADWSVCALYMRGRIFQEFGELLYSLPVPDAIADDPYAYDEYMFMLEDYARPLEDRAVQEYETAYPVMQQLGVINECTVETTRQLNRFRGNQYPIHSESIDHAQERLFSPQVYSLPPDPNAVEEEGLQLLDAPEQELGGGYSDDVEEEGAP